MIDNQRPHPGRKIEQVRIGAREVFLRDGYAGASVDDIARAARVSKATLYSYFPEKELMYRHVLMDEIGRLSAASPISVGHDTGPAEALPEMARQIAGWLVSGPAIRMMRANVAEAGRFPDVSRRYHALLNQLLRDVVRGHLDRWVALGALSIEDTTLAADQFVRLSGALLHDRALMADMDGVPDEAINRISESAARLFIAAHSADGQRQMPLAAVS